MHVKELKALQNPAAKKNWLSLFSSAFPKPIYCIGSNDAPLKDTSTLILGNGECYFYLEKESLHL